MIGFKLVNIFRLFKLYKVRRRMVFVWSGIRFCNRRN